MTKKDDAQKSTAAKKRTRSAPSAPKNNDDAQRPKTNGGLTGMQVLALWELVITGDGKTASQRIVKLDQSEVKGLESARLVTIENGPRKKDPVYGSKLHVTDEGWGWANQQGFAVSLPPSRAAVPVLEELLVKVGKYLKVHDLALDHLLRPRRADPEPGEAAAPVALEERIRAAYLEVTGGDLNQYVRLALLRAQLGDEAVEAVDAELRAMQQRGGAVLYPMDDPQRIRPEDDAAALRVAGERRDLLCIKG
jgi:hypothetical protein